MNSQYTSSQEISMQARTPEPTNNVYDLTTKEIDELLNEEADCLKTHQHYPTFDNGAVLAQPNHGRGEKRTLTEEETLLALLEKKNKQNVELMARVRAHNDNMWKNLGSRLKNVSTDAAKAAYSHAALLQNPPWNDQTFVHDYLRCTNWKCDICKMIALADELMTISDTIKSKLI